MHRTNSYLYWYPVPQGFEHVLHSFQAPHVEQTEGLAVVAITGQGFFKQTLTSLCKP